MKKPGKKPSKAKRVQAPPSPAVLRQRELLKIGRPRIVARLSTINAKLRDAIHSASGHFLTLAEVDAIEQAQTAVRRARDRIQGKL